MMVLVKNLHGTSDNAPEGFDSWRDYWIYNSGRPWPHYCSVQGCLDRAEVGAHVKLVDGYDNRWYIVPMCYKHNNDRNGSFYVDYSLLVPVND